MYNFTVSAYTSVNFTILDKVVKVTRREEITMMMQGLEMPDVRPCSSSQLPPNFISTERVAYVPSLGITERS